MKYLPPGRIDDFARSSIANHLEEAWHERVKEQIDQYRDLARFLDPLDADDTAAREVIPWTGFPRIYDAWLNIDKNPDLVERARRMNRAHRSAEILNGFTYVKFGDRFFQVPADPTNGWMLIPEIDGEPSFQDAFSLVERPQDEYLEWFVVRDPVTNRITRIDFTAEAPEYWETLAEGDPDLAQELYSELLGFNVPKEDLFFQHDVLCPELVRVSGRLQIVGHVRLTGYEAGQYNRWNKWNTERGAVHLTQRNNTLFAEINLAARATQRFAIRPDLGANVDRFALTACGGYGALNRNSDPTIGQSVNTLALSGFQVMVSNPIGLYIGNIDVSGFRDPDGNAVERDEILTVHRGTFEDEDGLARVLRFSVHPPAGADYGLESCAIDRHPLSTGGPVARQTTVVIHGIATPASGDNPLAECAARACAHPTKDPQYFLAIDPDADCPANDDERWMEAPVTLAPDESRMTAVRGAPRTSGERMG
ncbi:hypothetical protein [Halomonas heilongjiangensis]|uniref:Uncharacterized protein n=1 Tax=Halomonas heilongjiangensis TaxID=1387883 RepID=A0A2N7TM09_9GAMM|nr:hypothetical protein [Halomonas heilongjiangensis]PMR69223.1 hypothetical protein C1H66_11625 [Halomonas heilongjiangensis]PXX87414.1 hypothetical protein CR158_18780 [Halomonas heilongjiangensis]